MSNLIFQRTYNTENKPELMYVSFEKDGKQYKWFPKWSEIANLIHNSWVTEARINNDNHTEYLIVSMLLVVLRDSMQRNFNKHPYETGLASKLNELCDLFDKYYSGEHNAK